MAAESAQFNAGLFRRRALRLRAVRHQDGAGTYSDIFLIDLDTDSFAGGTRSGAGGKPPIGGAPKAFSRPAKLNAHDITHTLDRPQGDGALGDEG